MNRDKKEIMIHDLTEQLAVEKEICKVKEEQIKELNARLTKAMVTLKSSRLYTVVEIAELFGMDKAEVFDILTGN